MSNEKELVLCLSLVVLALSVSCLILEYYEMKRRMEQIRITAAMRASSKRVRAWLDSLEEKVGE